MIKLPKLLADLIPKKNQYNRWALSGKYSLISVVLGLVGIVVSVLFGIMSIYFAPNPTPERDEVIDSSLFTSEPPYNTTKSPTLNLRNPPTANEVLNRYEGDGNVAYSHLNFSDFPALEISIRKINDGRIEYNRRALDISILQDNLDSGNIELAREMAQKIVSKQDNIRKLRQ